MLELFAFLLGLATGSFLNVCIVRIPRELSVVRPRSHCPACEHELSWYENLPLLSYLALLGRCRSCKQPIGLRYPAVELITALLFLALSLQGFSTAAFFVYAALASALVVITFVDIDHYIIPDVITLPTIMVSPALALFVHHVSFVDSLLGILVGGGLLWSVAWVYEKARGQEGMGLGDVKLLAMTGGLLGWKAALFTLAAGSVVGSVVGIGVMIAQRRGMGTALPFGPFLAAGALAWVFWGPKFLDWYLSAAGGWSAGGWSAVVLPMVGA
ncbi:MAG: prepilin peptidase [Deltaproteobacteria bacterium]|nr:prepilin peptidase [Deltaproteobacteria bacterium]